MAGWMKICRFIPIALIVKKLFRKRVELDKENKKRELDRMCYNRSTCRPSAFSDNVEMTFGPSTVNCWTNLLFKTRYPKCQWCRVIKRSTQTPGRFPLSTQKTRREVPWLCIFLLKNCQFFFEKSKNSHRTRLDECRNAEQRLPIATAC